VTGPSQLALVASLTLVGLTAYLRLVTGTFFAPGTFFTLWWTAATVLPLVLAPADPVSVGAVAWIVLACLVVTAGGIVGYGEVRIRAPKRTPPAGSGEPRLLRVTLGIFLVLGIASSVTFVALTGLSPSELASLESLVLVSSQLYGAGSSELFQPPAVSQALLPFAYLAPAVGGVLFALSRRPADRVAAVIAVAPGVLITVLQTTKAATLFSMILWISGYMAARVRQGRLDLFSRGHLFAGLGLGGTVLLFVVGISLARLGATDLTLLDVALMKIGGAAFGHMTVFSHWLSSYWIHPDAPTYGQYTFAGLFDRLGLGNRVRGLFEESIMLANGDESNIFTAFRPLIQDFTFPGALVVLGMAGAVAGRALRLVSLGRWWAAPLLVATYSTTLWSPITVLWIYNSLIVALLLFGVTILACTGALRGTINAKLKMQATQR
jgi:oligosaccharide repeat unit polymerase